MRAGFAAVAMALMCAGCGSHSFALYPSADRSHATYSAVRQLRHEGFVEVVSLATLRLRPSAPTATDVAAADVSATSAATPRLRATADAAPSEPMLAAGGPLGAPMAPAGRESDAPERFVCADGAIIDVSYSLDRRTATVQAGDATAIELTRSEDTGLPTYQNGSTTLRRMGPRLGWSAGSGASGEPATVTVAAGDTLSSIALRRYGSMAAVADIVAANAGTISDPNLIFPGQVIALPGGQGGEQSCRRTVDASAS